MSSSNPHWIGDECCRDYQIGNIKIRSVPDSFVERATKFRGGYGFAIGNTDEFVKSSKIEITFTKDTFKMK